MLTTIRNTAHRSSDDELELMRRIKASDVDALEELYDHYKRLIFGIILSIVKKREAAEDLLQKVFVLIWNTAESFDGKRGNVYSWIVNLARSKAIDHIRSKGYETQQQQSANANNPSLFLSSKVDHYDPMETTIFSDRAELVKKALNEIPKKQREIIKIAYFRGLTHSEISDNLGIPIGTVKNRMKEGMIKLKRILGDIISTDV